jgi:outer membrane protein assembly factor BamB
VCWECGWIRHRDAVRAINFVGKAKSVQGKLPLLTLVGLILLAGCGSASHYTGSAAAHNHIINAALLRGSSSADWPMFGYDIGHTGYVDQPVLPHEIQGKLLWSQQHGPVFSSPVAAQGMLYIPGADGYLYALAQNTGIMAWRAYLGNHLTDATPALEGQVLFVALHSSALAALDARSGRLYWTFDTGEKIQAPPLVAGSRVLLASRTTVWALDTASGRLLWKFRRGPDGWPTSGAPALAGSTVYVGLGSGTRLWALDLNNGHILWSFDTGDRVTSAATVDAASVYIATWHGSIFALDRVHGTLRWSYMLNTQHSQAVVDGVGGSMALANGRLYVGDYRGSLLCIDATRGELLWRYATGAQILATPVVTWGQVYVGSGDGYFYALDARTGRPAWRYHTGEVRASASLASEHLYVGSLDGVVYAFA